MEEVTQKICLMLDLRERLHKSLLEMLGDKITIVIFLEQTKVLLSLKQKSKNGKLPLRAVILSKLSRRILCQELVLQLSTTQMIIKCSSCLLLKGVQVLHIRASNIQMMI
jgi:hypothetical protein